MKSNAIKKKIHKQIDKSSKSRKFTEDRKSVQKELEETIERYIKSK